MSILDLGVNGWRAFWSNIMAPGAIGLYAAVFAVALLLGFAFRREAGALMVAARVAAFMLAFVFLTGVAGALGVDLHHLDPIVEWLLRELQFPFLPAQGGA